MEGFAATAAHQLSEPLIVAESGTIMVAEELGDDLDPDLRARLDAIGRGAARARQMIDALLMDARSANGVELQPVDVASASWRRCSTSSAPRMSERGVVADVGDAPRRSARSRACSRVDLPEPALERAQVRAARRRAGGRSAPSAPRDGWRLIVASGGAPLPADQTKRIFEPWRRIPGERRAPGSGLGLAICARLVDRLGGTIGVEPPADGNAFYFVLPAA